MIELPETNLTAELTFNDRDSANLFARDYSRKTLMGHSISGSKENQAGYTVKVYNVTSETKAWIDSYVQNINA